MAEKIIVNWIEWSDKTWSCHTNERKMAAETKLADVYSRGFKWVSVVNGEQKEHETFQKAKKFVEAAVNGSEIDAW